MKKLRLMNALLKSKMNSSSADVSELKLSSKRRLCSKLRHRPQSLSKGKLRIGAPFLWFPEGKSPFKVVFKPLVVSFLTTCGILANSMLLFV